MKHIKDLTERDCIHCRTQEEFNAVLALHNPRYLSAGFWNTFRTLTVIMITGKYSSVQNARAANLTIHPASDFLTPSVNTTTEIGDYVAVKHKDGCIVIRGDKAMTLGKDIVDWIKENV